MDGADAYHGDADIPGMHIHETVDIVTVVAGEPYAVFEERETLLRPGDTIVVRGSMHTWSNRGDVPFTHHLADDERHELSLDEAADAACGTRPT
jgi:uncharacterized cupin superfamily protein